MSDALHDLISSMKGITSVHVTKSSITISAKPRRKPVVRPYCGRTKMVGKKKKVQQPRIHTDLWGRSQGYAVRRGKTLYEWVDVESAREDTIQMMEYYEKQNKKP